MAGARVGYIRVSSEDQKLERQLKNIPLDKVFEEKVSAKNKERPQLQALLNYVREGDKVIVHSLDRLARNLDDLRSLVKSLTEQGVSVEFIKENLIFTGEDSPMSNLLLSVMGAFAEFERALIRERQLEGIAIAKKKGLYKGRKKVFTQEQIQSLQSRAKNGEKKAKLAKEFGVSRETIYRYLRTGDIYSYENINRRSSGGESINAITS